MKQDWNYRRGDVYLADLGEPIGSEQGGIRPVAVIQNPHLWRIENGDRAASIDLMIVIAEYFSVSLDYLVLGKAADDTAIRRRVRILTYLGKLDYRDLCGIERAAVVNIKAERRRRKRRNGNEAGGANLGKK